MKNMTKLVRRVLDSVVDYGSEKFISWYIAQNADKRKTLRLKKSRGQKITVQIIPADKEIKLDNLGKMDVGDFKNILDLDKVCTLVCYFYGIFNKAKNTTRGFCTSLYRSVDLTN